MISNAIKSVRKNKKGFTMVEIIVVLVILAIMVGALTPTMIGFINNARGRSLLAEARVGMLAAQVVVVDNPDLATSSPAAGSDAKKFQDSPHINNTFTALAEDVITGTDAGTFSNVTVDTQGHVTGITYTKGNQWVIIAPGGVTSGTIPPTGGGG